MVEAAICREFNAPLSIEEVILASPKQGEVRVKIHACAICHSDIFYIDGAWGGTLPAIYGHEAAGEIIEIGDDVRDFAKGDKVLITLIRACGHCASCMSGSQVLCEHQFPLDEASPIYDQKGAPVIQGLRTAAFAEEVVVDQSQIIAIKDHEGAIDISMETASLLSCGVITGLGAVVNTAKMPFGAKVAVIGCGGVGLNTIQGAFLAGASQIIAVDIEEDKLTIAKEFGATHSINPKTDDLCQAIKVATQGRMVDFVFVTVGAKAAFDQAPSLIGRAGKIIIVGMPPTGVTSEYDPSMLGGLGQSTIGSKMGDTILPLDMPVLLSLYRQGRLKLDELVSNCYPLNQINEAIQEVKQGKVLRNIIKF